MHTWQQRVNLANLRSAVPIPLLYENLSEGCLLKVDAVALCTQFATPVDADHFAHLQPNLIHLCSLACQLCCLAALTLVSNVHRINILPLLQQLKESQASWVWMQLRQQSDLVHRCVSNVIQ